MLLSLSLDNLRKVMNIIWWQTQEKLWHKNMVQESISSHSGYLWYIILWVFFGVCYKWHQQVWRRKLKKLKRLKVSKVKNKIRWNIFIRLLHIVYTTKLYLKLQLSWHWLLWDLTFTKTEQRQNISKSCGGGGELSLKLEGAMILCHQCADLSTTFKWLNIGPTDYLQSAQNQLTYFPPSQSK